MVSSAQNNDTLLEKLDGSTDVKWPDNFTEEFGRQLLNDIHQFSHWCQSNLPHRVVLDHPIQDATCFAQLHIVTAESELSTPHLIVIFSNFGRLATISPGSTQDPNLKRRIAEKLTEFHFAYVPWDRVNDEYTGTWGFKTWLERYFDYV